MSDSLSHSLPITPIITVILSQGQSRSPEKRELEDSLARAASELPGFQAIVVPHLYDLAPGGESVGRMQEIEGPIVVLGWLYDRALHWVLDRLGIRGQAGAVELKQADDDEAGEADEAEEFQESQTERVTDYHPRPQRAVYCIDLRAASRVELFVQELLRIQAELSAPSDNRSAIEQPIQVIQEHPGRRWYPVIDFSRCTNCMECIDFCLFGVYGVDARETILVEQPDNCRKGCPACSRVCPANAIMFPQHKTPAIAGAPVDVGGFKIDLSKLFGAPDRDEDPVAAAARERDEQLILAGREAVGISVGLKNATPGQPTGPKDELDNLIDQLDALDL
jgi:hypothetical protein